jgi:hypothetical protein
MIPPILLNMKVNVMRRLSQGRDSLNNPVYGTPTSGDGWNLIYQNLSVRLAFSSRDVRFSPEGERILPNGIMYYNDHVELKDEDRVITSTGIEYVVIGVTIGYIYAGKVDHHEATLALP